MTVAIEIQHLTKVFARRKGYRDFWRGGKSISTTAIDDICLDIRKGETFGLLGPNGAGKTTLIKILSTLILPTDGIAKIYGYDVVRDNSQIKKLIGLIHSDERSFFWRLTGRQNLEFFSSLFQLPTRLADERIEELLALVELEEHADNMFHNYSTGMKQRLAIARGLLTHPKILFMDEALRSIDPITTQKIRAFIREKVHEIVKGTVIIATNRLDEAAQLCDRVSVLNKGRLVACGSTEELVALSQKSIQYQLEVRNISAELFQRICRIKNVQDCVKKVQMNGTMEIEIGMASEEALHVILQEIIRNNGYILKCTRKQLSLETAFHTVLQTSPVYEDKD